MVENNRLPDTPWHVGYAKKQENDPRRHKARCIHYRDGQCGWKANYSGKCIGSSHCMLDAYPSLQNMYPADDRNTDVFYFKNATATFSSFTHEPEVVKF